MITNLDASPHIAARYPLRVGGKPWDERTTADDLVVRGVFSGEPLSEVGRADAAAVEEAIASAQGAREELRDAPTHIRRAILERCVEGFEARRAQLEEVLCLEAGKPRQHARGEVQRLIDTFRLTVDESSRFGGELPTLDAVSGGAGALGLVRRMPAGVAGFITPFNFPLNLVAHKVAPAILAGCPFVLKPSSRTPISALILGEVLCEAELPESSFSILPCSSDEARPLVEDERITRLSFTGSQDVGWELKRRCGKARITLELGGNAACIIEPDADLDDAVEKCIFGAFYQSGQSCISTQRIIIAESIYEPFKERFVAAARRLVRGDPLDSETFLGPVISDDAADRICAQIDEAVAGGARLLCGPDRDGRMLAATVLEAVPRDAELRNDEVFGPVALLERSSCFDEALELAGDTRFGLQAGLFTRDMSKILRAWRELEVGGVVAGHAPSWRVDHMPYGGVRDSGLGREGIREALTFLTEPRLLAIHDPEV